MPDTSAHELLRQAVEGALPRLSAITEEQSRRPPAPGKWSPRQVVGHLIDSACNNHRRFVVAQTTDDLVFDTYQQDAWVNAAAYAETPWADVVDLWRLYNLQISRIMEGTSPAVRDAPRKEHNLDRIAFVTVPTERPTTLGYLMRDYVTHLEHHLAEVSGA